MKLHAAGKVSGIKQEKVLRVTTRPLENTAARKDYAFVTKEELPQNLSGYGAIIPFGNISTDYKEIPLVLGVENLSYLADGDVIGIYPNGFVRALYRRQSQHNFIFMTAQCNSFCLMCSQPPQTIDDAARINEHLRLIELIDPETEQLGITGGEPTLFKDDFLKLISRSKNCLPETSLHILTNGRLFYYRKFAEKLGEIGHPRLMLGIPLYSDNDTDHDYIVQAQGAFEETVIGLHHLGRYRVPVEIRVVIHRQTVPRLRQLTEFIARNFPFAAHIALMGLEMSGFVHRNYDELWIDPFEYQNELREAVDTLTFSDLNVSIYNHQLCLLDHSLWKFARKSISDWKNIYLSECENCLVKNQCGGFFQSAARKHSDYIKSIELS